jgi:hypothetical protein
MSEFIKNLDVTFEIVSPINDLDFVVSSPEVKQIDVVEPKIFERQEQATFSFDLPLFKSSAIVNEPVAPKEENKIFFDLTDETKDINVNEPVQFVPVTELTDKGIIRYSLEEFTEIDNVQVDSKPLIKAVEEVIPEELNITMKQVDIASNLETSFESISPMDMTIEDTLKFRSEERRKKLKEFNYKFHNNISKIDELEKVKEVRQLVDDICLEIEDELPVDVKPYFSKEQDFLSLDIKVSGVDDLSYNNEKNLLYSSDVDSLLKDVAERIKDYLKEEKYNFNYIIKYKVKGPLFYNGNAGRFGTEIIDAAEEYSRSYDDDSDKPLWNRYYKTLNVEKLSMSYASNDKLALTGSDLDTLLSDLDNCTKSWSLNTDLERYPERADNLRERNKVTDIELKQVSIVFKKVK